MNRSDFGPWGLDLDDDEFACAVAALFATKRSGSSLRSLRKRIAGDRVSIVEIDPARIIEIASGRSRPDARRLARTWTAWLVGNVLTGASRFRLEVRESWKDFDWLLETLSRPAVGAAAVYLRAAGLREDVSWEWPLRIGLFDDDRSRALRDADSPFGDLFRFVEVGTTGGHCDVLLIPHSLRTSLSQILGARGRLSTDLVLVTGVAGLPTARMNQLVRTIGSEVHCAGIAVVGRPEPIDPAWLDTFIAELSHDNPIDTTLFDLARRAHLGVPWIAATRMLVEHGRIGAFTKRFVARMSEAPAPAAAFDLAPDLASRIGSSAGAIAPTDLAGLLTNNMDSFGWLSEGGDASTVAGLREAVERSMRSSMRVPTAREMLVTAAEPPAVETRRLQAAFHREDAGKDAKPITDFLKPETPYRVEVHVGVKKRGTIGLREPIPLLAPSPEGHSLEVIFCELRDDSVPEPQRMRIHLPPEGDSETAAFLVRPRDRDTSVLARVIVLHRNRVLQTMLLEAPVAESRRAAAGRKIKAKPENVVKSTFTNLAGRQRFDAALIINKTPGGARRIVAASDATVGFFGGAGLDAAVDAIGKEISGLTKLEASPKKLDDPKLVALLWKLAAHGKTLWRSVQSSAGPLASASRIQVLEAREGAFLPVELFYTRTVPAGNPRICNHAAKALEDGDIKSRCTEQDDPEVLCPLGFWGFSRVIERRPHLPSAKSEYELSEPSLDRPSLDLLESAAYAASRRVRKADLGPRGVGGALSARIRAAPFPAKEWKDWLGIIARESPGLLVLLPHSLPDPRIARMPALEIGATPVGSAAIDTPYVLNADRRNVGPVVLLLGCSTELTEIPFQNFVSAFKQSGASLVVGTLSLVRGRHIAPVVARLLDAVSEVKAELPRATFGDALLRVRQQILAEGNPLAVSLIAYGDADWLI